MSRKYVATPWQVIGLISFILARFYNGFLVDQLVDQLSLGSFLLILIRNYNGFLVDMDFFRSRESSFEQGITMVS